jgi:hypothetical protein
MWDYSWAWEARPDRPDPARKWPGPSGQSMLSGRAWAGYFGPTRVTGRAWVGKNDDLLKARPDGPTARWFFSPTGRAWAEICGPTVGPGRAWAAEY